MAAAVVGGAGTFFGPLIGAFILVPLSEVLRALGALRIVFYGLFLVIFVFQFGFEHFKDQIGWPLVLFGAGLVSLALGIIAERMSRAWRKAD